MKTWVVTGICVMTCLVIFGGIIGYYRAEAARYEQQQIDYAEWMLTIKTEDLDIEAFETHYRSTYDVVIEDQLRANKDEIIRVMNENKDAILFHYNTPKETWRNLGGKMGYAIIYDSKIIWELRMIIS